MDGPYVEGMRSLHDRTHQIPPTRHPPLKMSLLTPNMPPPLILVEASMLRVSGRSTTSTSVATMRPGPCESLPRFDTYIYTYMYMYNQIECGYVGNAFQFFQRSYSIHSRIVIQLYMYMKRLQLLCHSLKSHLVQTTSLVRVGPCCQAAFSTHHEKLTISIPIASLRLQSVVARHCS